MNQRRYNQIRKRRKKILKRLCFVVNIAVMAAFILILVFWRNEDSNKNKRSGNQPYDGTADSGNQEATKEIETTAVPLAHIQAFAEAYASKADRCGNYVVCLDAGHGGDDVGAEGSDGQYEKQETLELALLIKEYLESAGVRVVMTRETDKTLSLSERKEIAENCEANLLLSIHRNVYEGTEDVNGIEAWINNCRPADASEISENILRYIKNEVPEIKNRGVKWGTMNNVNENYAVNKVSMASLILEVGFISSEYDNRLFEQYLDEFARGIAKGILENI